jgi:uncharacterized protein
MLALTGFYAAILTLGYIYLALRIIRLRTQHHVSLGSGGHDDLDRAIRAHGNFSEYVPLTLILFLALEIYNTPAWLFHALALVFLAGRAAHAYAFQGPPERHLPLRILGMRLTLGAMGAAAIIMIVQTLMSL